MLWLIDKCFVISNITKITKNKCLVMLVAVLEFVVMVLFDGYKVLCECAAEVSY